MSGKIKTKDKTLEVHLFDGGMVEIESELHKNIGIQVNRLKDHNVPILFGPGRHHPSGSVFLYFADPDGISIEYSQGMEAFPEEGAREPRRLEPSKETIDEWGGTPQPEFGQVGKLFNDELEEVKN